MGLHFQKDISLIIDDIEEVSWKGWLIIVIAL
jgi:hypothetical protein